MSYQVGDRVRAVDGGGLGTVVAIDMDSATPHLVDFDCSCCPATHLHGDALSTVTFAPPPKSEQPRIDRLNAENECYRKEAQQARALQRKFYDESVDLRKQLAQVTAERDAANQQCACVVQKYDDLRACLKALAR